MAVVAPLHQRLAELTGLDPALLDRPAVKHYVRLRCQQLALADEAAFGDWVRNDPTELERLIQEVSVAETWFFRYPASFHLLMQQIAERQRSRAGSLRMLSVACATGEEPYSMAMAAAAAQVPLDQFAVDAIDRNAASLEFARQARYGRNSFREGVPDWASCWLHWNDAPETRREGSVDAQIKERVRFVCHDILQAADAMRRGPYDVIFCRNLLIYLNREARTKLCELLRTLLAADGLLFVGNAECSILTGETFEPLKQHHAFALRRKAAETPAETPSKRPARRQVRQSRRTEPPPASTEKRSARIDMAPAPRAAATVSIDDARRLADAGQLEAAIAMLEALDATAQADCERLELLGSIQLGLGRLDQARAAFERVLYLQPNHETALLQMATISQQLGNAALARRYRQRATRAQADDVQTFQEPQAPSVE